MHFDRLDHNYMPTSWPTPILVGGGFDFGQALFISILQNFSDSPSNQIFKRMHGVLNIGENKN